MAARRRCPARVVATANAQPVRAGHRFLGGSGSIRRKFPSAYDGVTPMPLIFALHATDYSASGMTTYLVDLGPAPWLTATSSSRRRRTSASAPRTSNHAWRPTFQRCSRTS